MNADTYRPKFVRVPFDVLDNGYSFQPQSVIGAYATSGATPLKVDFKGWASVGDGGISYSWNFGDGSPLATVRDPSHTIVNQGIFKVELTVKDSKNNTATSSLTIYSGTTSVEGIVESNEDICIYPNPTKDTFVVELPNYNPQLPTKVIVSNAVGQEVLNEWIHSKTSTYRLKDNGTYYVSVIEGEKKTVIKLIKF
jgi:PKD repeat protein